jgi:hypothetical protein
MAGPFIAFGRYCALVQLQPPTFELASNGCPLFRFAGQNHPSPVGPETNKRHVSDMDNAMRAFAISCAPSSSCSWRRVSEHSAHCAIARTL